MFPSQGGKHRHHQSINSAVFCEQLPSLYNISRGFRHTHTHTGHTYTFAAKALLPIVAWRWRLSRKMCQMHHRSGKRANQTLDNHTLLVLLLLLLLGRAVQSNDVFQFPFHAALMGGLTVQQVLAFDFWSFSFYVYFFYFSLSLPCQTQPQKGRTCSSGTMGHLCFAFALLL